MTTSPFRFAVSLLNGKTDARPRPASRTWAQMCAKIETPLVRRAKDGPAWSPATFEPAHRCLKNVQVVALLVLDCDHDNGRQAIVSALKEVGIAYALHSTHSHLRRTEKNPDAEPRFRVIIPLETPIPAAQYPALWQSASRLPGINPDESAKDASRLFYTPSKFSLAAAYEFEIGEGAFLDWRKLDLQEADNNPHPKAENEPASQANANNGAFATHDERHKVLTQRIMARGKINAQGNYDAVCLAHGGTSKTGLVYFPDDGAVSCLKGTCDYAALLRAEGLPDGPLPNNANGTGPAHQTTPAPDAWPNTKPLPDALEPVPPLPSELLPDAWRGWLTDAAHRIGCPLEFLAVGAMVAASSVLGSRVRARPKRRDNWTVCAQLWGAGIGNPSTKKTPAFTEAMRPLRVLEKRANDDYAEAMKGFEFEKEYAEAQKNNLKAEMRGKKSPRGKDDLRADFENIQEPTQPILRRYSTNDATTQKLGALLSENPNGLLVFRDELTGFLKSLDEPGRGQDRAFYLEAANGGVAFTYDRVERGTVNIPSLTIALLGGIQPSRFEKYVHDAVNERDGNADGLLQRFPLMVYPDFSPRFEYVDREPNAEAFESAKRAFTKLADCDFDAQEASDELGTSYLFLNFDDDAQALFAEWLPATERRAASIATENPAFAAHILKSPRTFAALALLFHCLDRANGAEQIAISYDAAFRAAAWLEFLDAHAQRIYGLGQAHRVTLAERLLERIRKGDLPRDGFTERDVYRRCWAGLDEPRTVRETLALLADYGWLCAVEKETGGRPQTVYLAHPELDAKEGRP